MVWKLFMFMWRNAPPAMRLPVLALAVITGLSRDAMLFVTLRAASAADDANSIYTLLPLFVATLIVTSILHLAYPIQAQILNARMTLAVRRRLAGHLLRSTPMFVETRKHGQLYHVITSDVSTATYITLRMFEAIPGVVFLCVALPQVFIKSQIVGLFAVLVMIGGGLTYYLQQRAIAATADAIRDREINFFERISDLLSGFRELKLHARRRMDFDQEVQRTVEDMSNLQIGKERRYAAGETITQALKYLLLGGIVFLSPLTGQGDSKAIFEVLTILLFAMGPFEALVGQYPEFLSAGQSLKRVEDLDRELAGFASDTISEIAKPDRFLSLQMEAVTAAYGDAGRDTFVLGPIDFHLDRGETVFIIGNNGSGKTTFLNILAGLFTIRTGHIRVNDEEVKPGDASYRERFSAVFTSFHLFDRLFGLSDADPAQAKQIVERLMLSDVTEFKDGRFSRLNLSSGQRRRLALAVVLLEDRDIIILDEFVADQDPGKREFFFKVLLPELKASGKTIVVSTHDLSWVSYCDRSVRFSEGRITDG